MLVFNEGVPRSGKSYDAVRTHVLPALAAGRRVFARINGLNCDAIAEHLRLPVDRVADLLVDVPTGQVRKLFVADQDEHGTWCIADELKDALFVIDEAHEFYVASRNAIDPCVEQFFALCGQNGMDGVLMSQWYRRLHSSVRARVERKNVFQKMTAVGVTGRYVLKQYHATEPDRFELVDTKTLSYDKAIFPLYAGYAAGADNTAVYTAGGSTVWRSVGKWAWIVVPLLFVGVHMFMSLLSDHGKGLVKPQSHGSVAPTLSAPKSDVHSGSQVPSPPVVKLAYDLKDMPVEVSYVFDLCNKARARLAGVVTGGTLGDFGVVEWQKDQGGVIERLTFAQLRDLGVTVQVHVYGVKLLWKDRAVVVTPWPLPEDKGEGGSQLMAESASPAVVQAAPQSGGASEPDSSSRWKDRATAKEYEPPELAKRPDYEPHMLGGGS
ncbi:zonular occludens toxin domain-containing protein [Dyella psychrodurans]|uniref:Zona occludens toxin N-terminal domain-containing protein n=1 Tax=Dyella psychrodurans TaxID=1927960 RepID=A0A370XCY4_9GAMM|nr:zonular occludens toxin domain-containing protein [Dyella psychrodurans]RDS86117.1 hypothetical protein DWU99_02275 [Dyella psychrodurans]